MSGILTINLAAVQQNWLGLGKRLVQTCECAAVVKANAYGLGVEAVAKSLAAAGCNSFFVANLAEAKELRQYLPDQTIYILSGLRPGEESDCIQQGFIPVLVSWPQVLDWSQACRDLGAQAFCAIKVDTGMHRLGLTLQEFEALLKQPDLLLRCSPILIMSHLACADDADHPLNREQLICFRQCVDKIRVLVPTIKASLANSSGIFLGADYHFDLVRPGICLYGGNPTPGKDSPVQTVVTLELPIIQIKTVTGPASVGYNATYSIKAGEEKTLAIAAGGYADGVFVHLSNKGSGIVAGHTVPIVGRVSMDSTIFDISALGSDAVNGLQAAYISVLNETQTADDVATAAQTISYEVLTALGGRYTCHYLPVQESHVQQI